MKQKFFVMFVLFVTVFLLPHYLQAQIQEMDIFRQEGIASWYGKEFDGRPTASGEIYDSSKLTAAHPRLPFGTMLVVTNRHNNKKVTVRVNDRGPFVAARVIDVSRAAAEQLDMIVTGTAPVIVESVDRIVVSTPVEEPALAASAASAVLPALPALPTSAALASVPAEEAPPVYTYEDTPAASAAAPASSGVPAASGTVVQQPAASQVSYQIKLIPDINIVQNKMYRLQVGSYKIARNAVDAFERLKNAGLSPAYERYTESGDGEYFRVVLAGVRGTDVQSTIEKLRVTGIREAIIREEN